MNNQYLYFYSQSVGVFIFLLVLLINWKAKKHLIMGGLLLIPAAFLAPVNVDIWIPIRMFGLKVGIEEMLFSFLSGSISIGMVASLIPLQQDNKLTIRLKRLALILSFSLILFVILYKIGIKNYLHTFVTAVVIAGLVISFQPKLARVFLRGAILTTIVYAIGLSVGLMIWPDLTLLWDHSNLLGIYLFKFPIEEIVWAFLLGGTHPVIYFYVFDVSLRSFKQKDEMIPEDLLEKN